MDGWRRVRNETRIQPTSQDPDGSYLASDDENAKRQGSYQKYIAQLLRAPFVVEFAPAIALIMVPLFVHAGMFSSVVGVFSDSIIYDASKEKVAASDVRLLSSRTNPDPNAPLGGGDIIVDEGSLVSKGAFGEDEYSEDYASGEISVHTVRPCTDRGCETLSHIAEMYDVSVKTIMWANDISDPDLVQPGDELVILPITGVRHVIKSGDTIESIAKKYGGNAEEILSYNQLASSAGITVGDTIIIPGGNMHTAAPKQVAKSAAPVKASGGTAASSGYFTHPVPGATRTQGIHGYNAVDLAAGVGTPIRAAASGEVIVSRASGWNGGYGNYVVIKHANGTQTLYAHNSSNTVGVGAYVNAGDTIGYVGSSGRSTGSHLHFEVRGASNPF